MFSLRTWWNVISECVACALSFHYTPPPGGGPSGAHRLNNGRTRSRTRVRGPSRRLRTVQPGRNVNAPALPWLGCILDHDEEALYLHRYGAS
jgi:hypothetical protein